MPSLIHRNLSWRQVLATLALIFVLLALSVAIFKPDAAPVLLAIIFVPMSLGVPLLVLTSVLFAAWYSLNQGPRIYGSFFLLYWGVLVIEEVNASSVSIERGLGLVGELVVMSLVACLLLAANIYIIRRQRNKKPSLHPLSRVIKISLILAVVLILFATYKSFNGWFPSLELKQLRHQEQALQLPKASGRSQQDAGCLWDNFEDEEQCSPSQIVRNYKNTGEEKRLWLHGCRTAAGKN